MQSTAKTFFILAQKSLRYLVLSVRKMELTCLCCLLSLSPFTSETSTLLQARQRDRDLILSYYPKLFCWNGQGRTTVLTSLWQRGLVPTLLQTPEHQKAEGRTTVDFIISAPDKIWCSIFFTRHIASMVNIIQELEAKLDRKFYLASQWLTDLEGEERIS